MFVLLDPMDYQPLYISPCISLRVFLVILAARIYRVFPVKRLAHKFRNQENLTEIYKKLVSNDTAAIRGVSGLT